MVPAPFLLLLDSSQNESSEAGESEEQFSFTSSVVDALEE